MNFPIPVIDLFAGPGGLSEGFAALDKKEGTPFFSICLSIEKEENAYQTLLLRSFFRQFPFNEVPDLYYNLLNDTGRSVNERIQELYHNFPQQFENAIKCTLKAELGKDDKQSINERIKKAIGNHKDLWVLIGGPPCQAYSIIGRSRNKGKSDYDPNKDKKQILYKEYLQIIAEYNPAIFIMENVKGLLSATLDNQKIFERILEDLRFPREALIKDGRSFSNKNQNSHYQIYSLVKSDYGEIIDLRDYVVKMEHYGIPQSRHRLIILGIRTDLGNIKPSAIKEAELIKACKVLNGLPVIRSGISRDIDNEGKWLELIENSNHKRWFRSVKKLAGIEVYNLLIQTIQNIKPPTHDKGSEFIECITSTEYNPYWYLDEKMTGIYNHSGRNHIIKDIYRYLYASCFAKIRKRSPDLREFPKDLLPEHKNVQRAIDTGLFNDRFRVQISDKPATTVTSHISKDGHYYIHYDPLQCRSLTVREAARLQTFPDNYFFCGPRTAQYVQVGNAVPPLLAYQIAEIVKDLLIQSGI